MNYRVTLGNYRDDKYYPKVTEVVGQILETGNVVGTVNVLRKLGVLTDTNYRKWQDGQVEYLEKVIDCNLSKANRILGILGFHAHDLNMAKSNNFVKRKGKILRYTKSGFVKGEEMYARQFSVIKKSANK